MGKKKKPFVHHPKQDVTARTPARRRALNTGLTAVATSLFLPGQWTRPVVHSVLLPAHAQTSPEATPPEETSPGGAVYAVEGVVAVGFSSCETLTVCAVVNGDTAEVRHQTVWDDTMEGLGSLVVRTGTIPTDGSPGDMEVSGGPCSFGQPDRPAMITNLTEDSLTYTLDRPDPNRGPIEAVLFRVDACPNFPPFFDECDANC